MLEHAVELIQQGFALVPLKPGMKIMSGTGKLENLLIRDKLIAAKYWTPNTKLGIGILLGEVSSLVAVDLDLNHGATVDDIRKFPPTVTVRTRHGFHLYYRHPKRPIESHALIAPLPGKSATQAVAYLWTKNHQFVAPPTVVTFDKGQELDPWEYRYHEEGGHVFSFSSQPLADCPLEWCADYKAPVGDNSKRQDKYGPNTRHQMLLDTAVAMRSKGKSYEQITKSLHDRNLLDCEPPKTEADGIGAEIRAIADYVMANTPVNSAQVAAPITPRVDTAQSTEVAPVEFGIEDLEFPHQSINPKTGHLRRLSTIENLEFLLQQLGITVRYNIISKKEEITIPNSLSTPDNEANSAMAYIYSWCVRCGLAIGNVIVYLTRIADKHAYNPVAQWIESLPWDGHSRLQEFYNTIKTTNDPLKEVLMRRWLISAVAAVYEPRGVNAHGVLVFQGAQYLGKTEWFKRLAPASLDVLAEGVTLKPDDKDSVFQCAKYWINELGELDSTFSKSGISQLKAYIPKSRDLMRRPFCPKESEYARRTVFFGSVNDVTFLSDPTGNRRFWTVGCVSITADHKVDTQQLWAEVLAIYRTGETWRLTGPEMRRLNENNEQFQTIDPVEEKIKTQFKWENAERQWQTSTQVLQDIGYQKPTIPECRSAGRALRKLCDAEPKDGKHGTMFYVALHHNADPIRHQKDQYQPFLLTALRSGGDD